MKNLLKLSALALVTIALLGCPTDNIGDTKGTVFLVISDFDGRPFGASVNTIDANTGFLNIESLTIDNVAKNPNGTTSSLMDVELKSYTVTFRRVDSGTRVPPTYTSATFGLVPVDGNLEVENAPIMGSDQFTNVPLSDLLFENGGFDKETGVDRIILELTLQFFGNTITGDSVATAPASWQIEFVQ